MIITESALQKQHAGAIVLRRTFSNSFCAFKIRFSLYYKAFELIDADPNQEIVVLTDDNEEIIGTLQLSFIQYLAYQGGICAQIEAVLHYFDRVLFLN